MPDNLFKNATARHYRDKPLASLTDDELGTLIRISDQFLVADMQDPLQTLAFLAIRELSDRDSAETSDMEKEESR